MSQNTERREGVYDALKELGPGKTAILGLQHVFAMFGGTVLVPLLCGLSVSVTLFGCGLATIWCFFVTKRKLPTFLGSSFAFIGAFSAVTHGDPARLPYATGGVVFCGLLYVLLALMVHFFGVKKVMKLFPPVVTGPIIMLLGLALAGTAISDASGNWVLAIIALLIVIIMNVFGKGMAKMLPVLIGIFGAFFIGCVVTAINPQLFGLNWIDFSSFSSIFSDGVQVTDIVNVPPFFLPKFDFSACVVFGIAALAAIADHIGAVAAIGATCGKNFIADPGLTRTLLGDGVGTSIAGLFGGPANCTYSENTGVMVLTRVYDPKVTMLAGCFSIALSFLSIFDSFINMIPAAVLGGISLLLYGSITNTGIRMMVEENVDFNKTRNIVIIAVMLISGLGFELSPITLSTGTSSFEIGGLAVAAVFGILANLLLPGNDYEFPVEAIQGDE